jgi:hypothetical protein
MTKQETGIEHQEGLERRRLALFEDRYGPGSHERLLSLLRRPCVPFARIAARFQVTRERVRQWHAIWLPDAPSGRERRRSCAMQQQQRRLLGDELFAAFVRDVRRDAGRLQVEPVAATSGYRTRLVRLGGRLVALRDARQTARSSLAASISYRIVGYRGRAEYVYVRLSDADYLCVPVAELPLHGPTFVDSDPSRLPTFKNAFDALIGAASPVTGRPGRCDSRAGGAGRAGEAG